ncbi:MAG: GntP family permease [Erysipelotrichaceae bacterium]|nr:GntP family permease [Erysipelotrichaceae bacterium]MDP3306542.1 GntP family permease [Erysipelotrichaceae bacterium]
MWGIFLGLALLMFLAYRGMSIIWVAPIAALVVAFTGGLELIPAYTDAYMTGFVGFTKAWFPVFMLGAIFGKIMDETGAAKAVAHFIVSLIGKKLAITAVVLACAVLTYGGISLFVVVFAIYPIALALFRDANITRRLIPGAIALGSFTFTMTAVPGSPQTQNLIPIQYFGTTPSAAPLMGIAAALVMLLGGMAWLTYREKFYAKKGVFFVELDKKVVENADEKLPHWALSLLPLFVVVLTLNVANIIGKETFTELLGRAPFSIIESLVFGIVLAVLLFWKRMPNIVTTINAGAAGSVLAIINTSAAVGFGAVVRAVPGFTALKDFVLGIEGNPLIAESVAVNILAGATGSASGGMGIALEALGANFVALSESSGIPLEAFHRVASISSGGLDTLPHNGAVLTLLAVTAMTHKDSYIDIFMVATLIPIASVIVAIIMASFGIY